MKLIRRTLILLIFLLFFLLAGVWWLLHGSLARLDGSQALPGLTRAVTIPAMRPAWPMMPGGYSNSAVR